MTDVWTAVGGVSAGVGATAVVVRWLRGSSWTQQRQHHRNNLHQMSSDWVGEQSRPGFEGRPSFPERMSKVERRTEVLQHDFATDATSRLTLIGNSVDEIKAQSSETTQAVARLDFRVNGMDQRITDHRRRNEETTEALRVAVDEQKNRSSAIEQKLDHISEDLLRAETMRAVLIELGIPIDPPEH